MSEGTADESAEISKRGFARLLWRLADLVQAAESRRSFRAKAYRTAVWALDDLPGIGATDEQLLETPGIGTGVTALIKEYRSSGGINQLIPLDEALPFESSRLRRLPRMTPKMLRELKSLGIDTVCDLWAAINSGAARTVTGVGAQTLDLWQGILELPPRPGAIPAHEAWVVAEQLAAHIARHTRADVHVAGAVRRVEEWVDRIDLVSVADDPEPVVSFLRQTAALGRHEMELPSLHLGTTHAGIPVRVQLTLPRAAGTALFVATGPQQHVTRFAAEERSFDNEETLYRAAGLPWVPPPARELSLDGGMTVVTVADLRGDLHLHTEDSPDGRMSLETILTEAAARQYEYVLITDHTVGLRFGGVTGPELMTQAAVIDRIRPNFPSLTVFHGAELNVMQDGSLDIDDAALETLDFAVAGVHSHFGLDPETQTERVITALSHPAVRILAHPFGRRIGIRPPMSLDMNAVIDAAVTHGVALESNGHRDRLDLGADWIRIAAQRGALFAANSDAHRLHEMGNIANAVATLQKAGVTPERVVNTFDVRALNIWVSSATGVTTDR